MEDTTKKTNASNASKESRKLSDLYEEICSAQAKTISSQDKTISLLEEQIALKEKMFRMELDEHSTIVIPVSNGSNGVEINV